MKRDRDEAVAVSVVEPIDSRGRVSFFVNYLWAGHNAPTCLLLGLHAGLGSGECGTVSPFGLALITLRCARNDLNDSCCSVTFLARAENISPAC